jgi:hypothetical protein
MGGNMKAACGIAAALLASATAFVPAPLQAVRQTRAQLRMAADGSDTVPNKYSSTLTQRKSQGASQAMLYATGLTVSAPTFACTSSTMHVILLAFPANAYARRL